MKDIQAAEVDRMARSRYTELNKMLEERSAKIQGEMEKAESTRQEADTLLADYRAQLAGARDKAPAACSMRSDRPTRAAARSAAPDAAPADRPCARAA